jgi:malate dehydrogenase (oxaloacetate-decarboxylating)(NADP+)
MFNDDIQGTASVALAGVYSALRISGKRLRDQRFLFFGAGEAGTGVGELLVTALMADGLPEIDARRACWFIDSKGLVVDTRTDLTEHKRHFAQNAPRMTDPVEMIDLFKPTALIGASGQPGTFTREVIEHITHTAGQPLIFALSNPTSKAECTAEQAYQWSEGRAIFASGSPFGPVELGGQQFIPGQGNNAYIFPGVGLGVLASGSRSVTDEMFLTAAQTLANLVTDYDRRQGRIYPPLSQIREVSLEIAVAVAEIAEARGFATEKLPASAAEKKEAIRAGLYDPHYQPLV